MVIPLALPRDDEWFDPLGGSDSIYSISNHTWLATDTGPTAALYMAATSVDGSDNTGVSVNRLSESIHPDPVPFFRVVVFNHHHLFADVTARFLHQ